MEIVKSACDRALNLLFVPEELWRTKVLAATTAAILILVYFSGLIHWGIFLSFGTGLFEGQGVSDWGERNCPYDVLREVFREFVVPYRNTAASCMPPYSDRFMGNLQPNLSPQVILLPFLANYAFILFNLLFMYTLGFAGCLLFLWRYRLALLPFSVIFLLFNLNGHITSHISLGHPWNGYFLIPFFVVLVLELVRPEQANKLGTAILLAFVLFGMVLQGSFHIYAMCAIFLFLVGIFNRYLLGATLFALGASVALSMFRFLPSIFVYEGTKTSYASGFPTFSTFVDALTTIKAFAYEHPRDSLIYDVPWHEHDTFIGYLGVAFIIFFGIYMRFRASQAVNRFKFQALDLPILLVILFSFGIVTDIISDLQIPMISWAERVPSRFFVLPLIFLVVIGAVRMQAFVSNTTLSNSTKFLLIAGTIVMAHSLAAHSWFWRILDQPGVSLVLGAPHNSSSMVATTAQDASYVAAVKIGAVVTLMAIITLASLFYMKTIKKA